MNPVGLEPTADWLKASCSTKLSYGFAFKKLVLQVGLEPTTYRLQGDCSAKLSYYSNAIKVAIIANLTQKSIIFLKKY